ncbi:MAG: hypothetical protein ACYS5V_11820 [Planctomycetota bacterium]|jgi:hypothetical protein
MFKLILLLVLTAMLCSMPACSAPSGPARSMVRLAQSKGNLLRPFTPEVTWRRGRQNRHVPMVYFSSPWQGSRKLQVEVPEYVHGRADGDRRRGFLFAGRALATAERIGGVRYASKTPPKWARTDDGGLAMDNPLERDVTVHFRVIPRDRLLEVRFGLTNGSAKTLRNCWAQICFKGVGEPVLAERHPTSSFMLSNGELISWDGAGQDLSWLEKERDERRPGFFRRSCFFLATVGKGKVVGRLRRGRNPVLTLGRKIDAPIIAKSDKDRRRSVLVYSPSGVRAFYNVLQPCFHVDPHLGDVPPGSTRWAQTYLIFHEGDLKKAVTQLAKVHGRSEKVVKRE